MSKQKRGVRTAMKSQNLDRLSGDEAMAVLRQLVERHPDLKREVEMVAASVLGEVSSEAVADEVEDALRSLDLDDLNTRAGPKASGYVEPTEAAWELVEEAVTPFLDDIKRRAESGQFDPALATCVGVVLGLYRLRNSDRDPFLGWAADSPDEMAGEAIVTLLKALRAAKTTLEALVSTPPHCRRSSATPLQIGPKC